MMRKELVVVAFGDSTTATRDGITVYPGLLARHCQQRQPPVRVINAGVRGDHTERALARFEHDVLAHTPTIVIIRFGINDAAVDVWATPPASEPRVPLAKFRANLVTMVDALRTIDAQPILCTPNPLAWSEITLNLYGQKPYDPADADGFNLLLREYVAAIHEVAAQMAIPLVDIDTTFRQHKSESVPPWQNLLLDGMHPNDEGQQLAAALLIPLLDKMLDRVE